LALWALLSATMWIAGDWTRLRRERIAELEEQARRIELETERTRRLAAAEERTRIARELHDAAGHAINVILVQAGAARLLHQRDPAGSRQAIATIEQVARGTIGEIDQLVRALREDEGTSPPTDPAALEELVERHRAGGLRIAADIGGPRRALPHAVAWATYRILQEALTNATRHGRGSADVMVGFGPNAVDITVTNPTASDGSAPDGPGVGHGAWHGGGHGIIGMRERATLLDGILEAGAERGTFRLHARLPYGQVVP
jgi:signal transduction histidine kinase